MRGWSRSHDRARPCRRRRRAGTAARIESLLLAPHPRAFSEAVDWSVSTMIGGPRRVEPDHVTSSIAAREAWMGRAESRFVDRASWLLRLPLDTPTIAIDDEATGCTLWLKLDYLLPSGCTKDRMATNIVAHAIASGEVTPSCVVGEASSGSTSIALSMVCASVGVP